MNNVVEEVWKDIEGYEGIYQVSSIGEVKSIFYNKKPKILKRSKTTTGYYKVELYKDKNRKSFKVHRLVAKAFILNPESKPNINHIDGNPLNNHVNNLEWCTQKENVLHAIETGLKKKICIPKKELKQLYIYERKPMREIGEIYGVADTTIKDRLKEYGIKTRTTSQSKIKYGLTEDFIMNELKIKTQTQLAKEIGCDQSLISHYLKRIKRKGKIYA